MYFYFWPFVFPSSVKGSLGCNMEVYAMAALLLNPLKKSILLNTQGFVETEWPVV